MPIMLSENITGPVEEVYLYDREKKFFRIVKIPKTLPRPEIIQRGIAMYFLDKDWENAPAYREAKVIQIVE